MQNKINETLKYIESQTKIKPEMALVLGTGLNNVAELLSNPEIIDYENIPNFKQSTAPGHSGRLVFGKMNDMEIVIMQGRLHYYEGYKMEELTFPIRLLAALGIETLFLTNAAGSLNPAMQPGNLVIIEDHLNLMGTNPLIGKNIDFQGERFPSMHEPYNLELIEKAEQIAMDHGFKIQRGTYAAVSGPSLETRAECRMIQKLGADLVGMSTVPEVIVAIHCGLKVIAISSVTNLGNIFHREAHTQEEIRKNADRSRTSLEIIIKKLTERR